MARRAEIKAPPRQPDMWIDFRTHPNEINALIVF
jgi:hypothetical protein